MGSLLNIFWACKHAPVARVADSVSDSQRILFLELAPRELGILQLQLIIQQFMLIHLLLVLILLELQVHVVDGLEPK